MCTEAGRSLGAKTKPMTSKAAEVDFKGPYERQLGQLADLIGWLVAKHDKSFVKAGDDKVYAYGGNGYVLVFDETTWRGLIELFTPKGAVSIKQNEDGTLIVQGSSEDQKELTDILQNGVRGLRSYYENRYWATPHNA